MAPTPHLPGPTDAISPQQHMHDQLATPMRVRRILVCGYYGFANTGDEAILVALLEDLRANYPRVDIVVMAGSPGSIVGEYGVEAFHWQDVARLTDEARRSDLMVLGGGGLFQDHQGFQPAQILTSGHGTIGYYAGFALLAGMTSTPLVIYGVGVGPISSANGRDYTRMAFGCASAATVRDEASLALLSVIGADTSRVRVTADPVWTLKPAPFATAHQILHLEGVELTGTSTIGIAVRPWGALSWARELAVALDHLVAERDALILFVPFQDSPHPQENDAHAALAVMRQMERCERTAIIRGAYTPEERMAILGSCDLVIGMRLHAVIFAANARVPVVALSYDPKVEIVMERLGAGGRVIDLDGLTAQAVVEAASQATAVDEELVLWSRGHASRNRLALVEVSRPPPPDEETLDAYADLLITRIHEQTRLESEISTLCEEQRRLGEEYRSLEIAHERLLHTYDVLENRYQAIVGSRMYRLANGVWRLRAGIQSRAETIAKMALSLPRSIPRQADIQVHVREQPEQPELGNDSTIRREIEAQIRGVLAEHADAPGIVVFPPTIGWQVTLFQRPQQMALAFSRLGYLVLYGLDGTCSEGVVGLREISPRIYLTKLPVEMMDLLEAVPDPIAVSYVYNFNWTKQLKNPAVVFEHIDELEVFETSHQIETLRSWYEEAVTGADLVVASARTLLGKIRDQRPDAVLCPNGVDYRYFADSSCGASPEDIAPLIGKPIIGYYGAIADWLDFALIRRSACELIGFEFVFIGPLYQDSDSRHLKVFDLPNVHWLGAKQYQYLPSYLHVFDVATIPFVVNEVTHAVSPVKLFEYMAGGRPVVTPNLHECAQYEAVLVATDADDYISKLQRAVELRHDPEHQALLRRTARSNTWDVRAGTLIDALVKARHR